MKSFNPPKRKHPSGWSWGTRGFRIGRNQFGNWWISVSLPFGFRYTKTLGKLVSDNSVGVPGDKDVSLDELIQTEIDKSKIINNKIKWRKIK